MKLNTLVDTPAPLQSHRPCCTPFYPPSSTFLRCLCRKLSCISFLWTHCNSSCTQYSAGCNISLYKSSLISINIEPFHPESPDCTGLCKFHGTSPRRSPLSQWLKVSHSSPHICSWEFLYQKDLLVSVSVCSFDDWCEEGREMISTSCFFSAWGVKVEKLSLSFVWVSTCKMNQSRVSVTRTIMQVLTW